MTANTSDQVDVIARTLARWVDDRFEAPGHHLFKQYPEYTVFRHRNRDGSDGPWFLLVCNIDYRQIGVEHRTGEVFVAVVKADPRLVDELSDRPGYARGWHMNKSHWLSILLDGTVPMSDIHDLVRGSYVLTKPSNPKGSDRGHQRQNQSRDGHEYRHSRGRNNGDKDTAPDSK